MVGIDVKYQACLLSDALHRNINDNFENVSFEILKDGNVQVQFILKEINEHEGQLIDDVIAEFAAPQSKDCVLMPLIKLAKFSTPLKYVVYQVGGI